MAEVTASQVKELREKTGAGMMDCKKALAESDGDLDQAVDWLRKKGLSQAAKKAGRTAADGLVGVHVEGHAGAMVEVNAETDFVARNETFQEFVSAVVQLAARKEGDLDALKAQTYPGTERTVEDQVTHLVATVGENMRLRRSVYLAEENGVVASYVHNAIKPGLGKIGVLVSLRSDGDKAKLEELGRHIAMHIAASAPEAVSRDDLDPAILERERKVLTDQASESGKPAEIVEKMVEGRLRKYYEQVCLVDQIYAIDGESRVGDVLENAAKDAGAPVTISGFALYKLGEGIEKEEGDFASEVAAAAQG